MKYISDSRDLFQTKTKESLSEDVVDAIETIMLDKRYPPKLVGSFNYVVHEYPADIDMFEYYEGCCSTQEVARQVVVKIQDMIRRIATKRLTYLGDFKAGVDKRYAINIGEHDGIRVKHYNTEHIKTRIRYLHNENLLTDDEIMEWLSLVVPSPSYLQHAALDKAVRSRYVLRWTSDEVLAGVKKLPLEHEITLEDALLMRTIVKVDMWMQLHGRFTEITNWMLICAKDTRGRKTFLSEKPDKYERSLKADLKLYMNRSLKKHMKLAKRMWLYAVFKKDVKLMSKLAPLFSSGAAKLGQIVGEIDTLLLMLNKLKTTAPLAQIYTQVQGFKARTGTVPSTVLRPDTAQQMYHLIDQITSPSARKAPSWIQTSKIILDALMTLLNDSIDLYARKFTRKHGIMKMLHRHDHKYFAEPIRLRGTASSRAIIIKHMDRRFR
jgi:hypothetical protein